MIVKARRSIKQAFIWAAPAALGLVWLLAACQSAIQETVGPQPTQAPTSDVVVTPEVVATVTAFGTIPAASPPPATLVPTPLPSQTDVSGVPTLAPSPVVEARRVDLEWPQTMRLGDSDIVRLSLIPSGDSLRIEAEFEEHAVESTQVAVDRPPGYSLYALARLDAIGFDVAPSAEQESPVPEGEALTWRWTLTPLRAGQQRLAVGLILRWQPDDGSTAAVRESLVFSKGLNVRVLSFFGMTRGQAMMTGFFGLLFGGGLSLLALLARQGPLTSALTIAVPGEGVTIEPHPELELNEEELSLFKTLFRRYGRVVLEREFLSGYSGARTFLGLPILPDGRADAYTIVKLGQSRAIQLEFENYESFVKNTLPPVTARIQAPPVTFKGAGQAALPYTFLGAPGQAPVSLRRALLEGGPPSLLTQIFETFGPNWWMQRRPYAFRLAQEYDRKLPAHYTIAPDPGNGVPLDGRRPPPSPPLEVGENVTLRGFSAGAVHPNGGGVSLIGVSVAGQSPLRVRWLSRGKPEGAGGRVVATRASVLAEATTDLERFGLPDPFAGLEARLAESVRGTASVNHGDLNLENVLLGPGGIVWLIDFAETREAHTLFDFAHLQAQLIAHVLPSKIRNTAEYADLLSTGGDPWLAAVEAMAQQCLFNPEIKREYDLALYISCLGALKFKNLAGRARHFLYLTAANLV